MKAQICVPGKSEKFSINQGNYDGGVDVMPLESKRKVRIMQQFQQKFTVIIILGITIALVFSCAQTKLTSHWAGEQIEVNGNRDDWQDRLRFIEKNKVALGIANDDENLYFCVVVSDPAVTRQMVMRGLTVWLDPNGGQSETYGIKYPIGLMSQNPGMRPQMMQDRQSPAEAERRDPRQFLQRMLTDCEVIDKTGKSSQLSIQTEAPLHFRLPAQNNDRGIELQIRQTDELLVYEGKIPLSEIVRKEESAPVAGTVVGLGLETGERNISQGERPGGGFPGGRGGGPSGKIPGRPGGDEGRNRADFQQESLKFWGKIQLTPPYR